MKGRSHAERKRKDNKIRQVKIIFQDGGQATFRLLAFVLVFALSPVHTCETQMQGQGNEHFSIPCVCICAALVHTFFLAFALSFPFAFASQVWAMLFCKQLPLNCVFSPRKQNTKVEMKIEYFPFGPFLTLLNFPLTFTTVGIYFLFSLGNNKKLQTWGGKRWKSYDVLLEM